MCMWGAQRFFRTFHEGRDDRSVAVSPWRQHPGMGRVRELTFVSPVKMRLGISPSVAHCHQTQRYRRARPPTACLGCLMQCLLRQAIPDSHAWRSQMWFRHGAAQMPLPAHMLSLPCAQQPATYDEPGLVLVEGESGARAAAVEHIFRL
jgi:hypothetical protein